MNVALLNEKITFQEATVITDNVGNKKNAWSDVYSCYATISGESANEDFIKEAIEDRSMASFTVRYCDYISGVKTTTHRIKYNGEVYNIVGIDHQSYKKKSYKFITRKERL